MKRQSWIWVAALAGAGGAVAVIAGTQPDIRYDEPKSTFEREVEAAPERARDNPPGADKATREGEAARAAGGVGHGGQLGRGGLSPKDGPSIGGSMSADDGGKAEGHIRFDTDPKPADRPASAAPAAPAKQPERAPPERSDRSSGDRPDHGGRQRDGGFMHDGFHSDLSHIA